MKYATLRLVLCFFISLIVLPEVSAQKSKQEFYELKVYRLKSKAQETAVDNFLKDAFIPALHQAGVKNIGVFKPVETDTTAGKRIYVLIPYNSLDQMLSTSGTLAADKQYNLNGKEYLDAVYTNPPYERIETILLKAFEGMPRMEAPSFSTPKSERIYELRSYESATEKIHVNKVQMFNQGDEIGLFKQLGFNAVFYSQVIAGGRMPNLMYMTSFANQTSRDEHWNAFREAPQWKKLSAMEEYQHNVSKNTQYFLHPAEYSDY